MILSRLLKTKEKKVTLGFGVVNVEAVETGSVSKPSVSVIDCGEKNISKEKTKDCDVVISNKRSPVRLEEEMSTDFVNQVLSETVAFVIDEIERNVASGVVSQLESSAKANKGSPLKCSADDEGVVKTLRGKD